MALNIIYLNIFLASYKEMYKISSKFSQFRYLFFEAANIYLSRVKEHWKPIDGKLWNDESKLSEKMLNNFNSLAEDWE